MRRVIVGLLFLVISAAANAATLHETVDRTFDVKAGSKLTLQNVNGHVTITGWDQPGIRVRAAKSVGRADGDDARRAMADLKIVFDQGPRGLSVRTEVPRTHAGFWDLLLGNWNESSVDYEVSVPRTLDLGVMNTNGTVEVFGVHGFLELETTNGRIEMSRCSGGIDASTTNGRIVADLSSVDERGAKLETTNGRIEISLPAALKANLDAHTTNGGVESELPVTTRSNGDSSLRGSINGGGIPLRLNTTNGSITIRARASNVSASK